MDYNDFRGVTTLLAMIAFLGVVWWAYSSRSKRKFDSAANSIFDNEEKQLHDASVKEVDK